MTRDYYEPDMAADDRIFCSTPKCGEWGWEGGDVKVCPECEERFCPECLAAHACVAPIDAVGAALADAFRGGLARVGRREAVGVLVAAMIEWADIVIAVWPDRRDATDAEFLDKLDAIAALLGSSTP